MLKMHTQSKVLQGEFSGSHSEYGLKDHSHHRVGLFIQSEAGSFQWGSYTVYLPDTTICCKILLVSCVFSILSTMTWNGSRSRRPRYPNKELWWVRNQEIHLCSNIMRRRPRSSVSIPLLHRAELHICSIRLV